MEEVREWEESEFVRTAGIITSCSTRAQFCLHLSIDKLVFRMSFAGQRLNLNKIKLYKHLYSYIAMPICTVLLVCSICLY